MRKSPPHANTNIPSVVIIGAPRSGTNMLRDALSSLAIFSTWPCDEINYIWRHGNMRVPHDELQAHLATPRVRSYIRSQFNKRAAAWTSVVEKTCANSLRVPFVNAVLPEAKFVWIVRDARDAVPSAERRWHAKVELGYAMAKARFIPARDLPYYGVQHLIRRAHRVRSPQGRLGSWGPRLHDMEALLGSYSLLEVCAIQWLRCVKQAQKDLNNLELTRVYRIRYEDFVAEPIKQLTDIADFAGKRIDFEEARRAVAHVRPSRATATRSLLTAEEYERIEPIVGPEVLAQGYA